MRERRGGIGRWVAAITIVAVAAVAIALLIGGAGFAATGTLTPRGCIDDNDTATDPTQGEDDCALSTNGLKEALAVAVSRDGKSLYSVSNDDAVVRFKRNTRTGALTPKGCIDDNDFATDPSQGEDQCARSVNGLARPAAIVVTADGRSVYVASENDDAIVRFKRNTRTGALTPGGCIDDNDTSLGQGPDKCAKSANGLDLPTSLAVTGDGRWLYVAAEGDDAVVRFERNTRTGALTPRGCIDDNDTATDADQGPDKCARSANGLNAATSVALSRGGKSLYAGSEGDTAIARFARTRKTGALRPKGCIEDEDVVAGDSCAPTADGLTGLESLALSPDAKSLYAVSEGDDAIVRFKRNARTGALTPKGCIDDHDDAVHSCGRSTSGMEEASSLALSRDGRSVYVAAGTDDAIVRFKRNSRTGGLKPGGCIDDDDFITDPNQGEDDCARSANGLHSPESVALSPDGRSFYAPTEEDDAIVRFKRAPR